MVLTLVTVFIHGEVALLIQIKKGLIVVSFEVAETTDHRYHLRI